MRWRGGKVNVPILAVGMSIVIGLVVLLNSGFGKDPRAVPDMLSGTDAPTFALMDLDGNPFSLDSLEGTPVVLNFWSTWCGPCKFEHPLLQQAQAAFPEIRFLGVIYSDDPDKVRRYVKTAGAAYPSLIDPGNRIAMDYGVAGVPETFFIDRRGKILFKKVGPLSGQEIQHWVDTMRAP